VEITLFQKISPSLFQYSERTIASTETNDTSEESSDTQLFGAGGVALLGGSTPTYSKKTLKKK
jgi:hypothetical protein